MATAYARPRPEPSPVRHPYFGELVLQAELDWWEARPPRHPRIQVFLAGDTERLLPQAEAVCRALDAWREAASRLAARRILTRELDGPMTDRELRLESVSFHPCGQIVFFFDGGELFHRQSVEVTGSIARGLVDARLAG